MGMDCRENLAFVRLPRLIFIDEDPPDIRTLEGRDTKRRSYTVIAGHD